MILRYRVRRAGPVGEDGKEPIMNRTMTLPIEQEEVRRISPTVLTRRSGLLAIAAGASMILVPFVHPSGPQSATWVPVHLLYFATLMANLSWSGSSPAKSGGPGYSAWLDSSQRSSAQP